MERNQAVMMGLVAAGLLAAVAFGVIMRGTSTPEVPAPEPVADHAPAAPSEPGARTVPAAPSPVPEGGYVTTASGLQYHDVTVGSGASPAPGSIVVVEYTGWLADTGKSFDSSYKRHEPFEFALGKGNVIAGWDEGVAGMKVGGKRQLKIPAELGYGAQGAPPVIPSNATLVFDVELKEVKAPRVAPEKPQVVAEADLVTTPSGLKYHDFEVGTGAEPKAGDMVLVDYTGWLLDGTKFDSSLDRAKPINFPLGKGKVIPGWDEGIASMKEGGRRQLVIPPNLAYGERGRPPVIPPSATLVFEVHLVDVP